MVFFVEVSLGHANAHLKSLACIWGVGESHLLVPCIQGDGVTALKAAGEFSGD